MTTVIEKKMFKKKEVFLKRSCALWSGDTPGSQPDVTLQGKPGGVGALTFI